MHVGAHPSHLPDILNWHGKLPAMFAEDRAFLEPGRLLVAPPDHHMLLRPPGIIRLNHGTRSTTPAPRSILSFASAAATYGRRVVGVVLSGRSQTAPKAFA